MISPVLHALSHTVLWELKPVPLIVTITSPLLGPVSGETLEIVGEAVAGIPATTSRHTDMQSRKINSFI
jgi:hypothetical protein